MPPRPSSASSTSVVGAEVGQRRPTGAGARRPGVAGDGPRAGSAGRPTAARRRRRRRSAGRRSRPAHAVSAFSRSAELGFGFLRRVHGVGDARQQQLAKTPARAVNERLQLRHGHRRVRPPASRRAAPRRSGTAAARRATGPRRAPDASSASSAASAPSNRPSAHSRSNAASGSSGAAGTIASTSSNDSARPPAAALLRGLLRVQVGEVVRERGLEVGAQPAAARIQPRQEVALQQVDQESLHDVLRAIGRQPLLAQVNVERLPARRAQLVEHAAPQLRAAARGDDPRPARLREGVRHRAL